MQNLVIRYRKGTLLNVPLNPIEEINKNIFLVDLNLQERRNRIEQIKDGSGWGERGASSISFRYVLKICR